MNNTVLDVTKEERDLGIVISNMLRPAAQCAKAAKTAQAVLGQITRAFQYRDRRVFLQLYKQYVHPHLEFATQSWSPWLQADIGVLEKVQRRAVGMVFSLQAKDYEDRLRELGLTTLEERRHQADMAHMYKICTCKDGLNHSDWFEPPTEAAARTRRHIDPLNMRPHRGRLEIRRNFFTVRAGDRWNDIPSGVKHASTASSFKKQYAEHRAVMI
jgi:hypothetical protein